MFPVGLPVLLVSLATGSPASLEGRLANAQEAIQAALNAKADPRQARAYFRDAVNEYEELYQNGHHNVACLKNEGNAALLAGDLPHAILAYRRGLRLAPNDQALRSSLAFARDQVDYPDPGHLGRQPPDPWPLGLPRPRAGWLLAGTAILYALGCVLLTRWWMTRKSWLISLTVVSFVLAAFPMGGLIHTLRSESEERRHPLVVISENGVLLRTGNGLGYPARYETPLNRGVEARLLFRRGDWLQIELAAGETGWISKDYALVDDPH